MAFINGREVFFSPQVNGLLTEDAQEKIEQADMTLNWLKSYIFEQFYDFENLYCFDLFDLPFKFSQYERSILDNYTTTVTRTMNINSNPDLLSVTMPNVINVQTRGFYNCSGMVKCELGQIISTVISSFQGCTALETFKCKPRTTGDIYLQYSPNLLVRSLEGIIDSYADMTGQTAPTLYIGETNIAKLSKEYKQKAANKNIILK